MRNTLTLSGICAALFASLFLTITFASAAPTVLQTGGGGTGTSTFQTASIPFFNGTRLTENNANFFWTDASTRLTVKNASTTAVTGYTALFGGSATSTFGSNGALTLVNALTYGGVTLSNAVTGTGNMVLSAGPTFTGTAAFSSATHSGTMSVTGQTTLGQASTTILSVLGPAYFGSSATSTFSTTGALTLTNALTYGGVTLSNAVTGTGNMVLSTSPVFTTPNLGVPSALTLTNATGLPIGGITGLGTGVGTALAVNVGSAGAFVTFNGALGTPSSGTLTSATGLPVSTGISGLGTGIATWLATPSSANLASALTDETGTGAAVFAGSPTFTGTALFANASSTLFSVFNKAYFGGSATTTIDSSGNVAVAGTLNVTGATTLGAASTTHLTAGTSFQIPNSSSQAPTTVGYVAQDTTDNQFVYGNTGSTSVIDPRFRLTLSVSTTTTWTGSSTIPVFVIPQGVTITKEMCTAQPNGATLNAQLQYANSSAYATVLPTMVPASSTPGIYTLSSNNTPTAQATSTITFGTPAGSPTSGSCTFLGTITGT